MAYDLVEKYPDRDVRSEQDAAVGLLRQGLDDAFDVGKTMETGNDRLDAQRPGRRLKWATIFSCGRVIGIVDHRNMRDVSGAISLTSPASCR